jgi:hypothetical protein
MNAPHIGQATDGRHIIRWEGLKSFFSIWRHPLSGWVVDIDFPGFDAYFSRRLRHLSVAGRTVIAWTIVGGK